MKKFLNEFETFTIRGNVVDMAVGIVIEGTLGKTITSFMNDIIMPPIGPLLGSISFKDLSIKLDEKLSEDDKIMEVVAVNYDNFIQQTINSLTIAFCIFLLIKAVMKLTKRSEGEPEPAKPEPATEGKLLTGTRDLLKNK